MQNRIEETKDFETIIRDDLIKLLEEIKKKMYNPARAKYKYVTLTESLKRILDTKQEDDESLIDYTKRFKQARDIVKDSMGLDILHNFVESTSEYQKAEADGEEDIKKKLKVESFGKWTTYLYLQNSDQRKYGSLMRNFRTQYSLGNNQYCVSISKGSNVLTNHVWDATYKESMKKRKAQHDEAKNHRSDNNNNNDNDDNKEKSFAQKKNPTCYCCGGNHFLNDCEKKDKIPKDEWVVRKGIQMYNKHDNNNNNNNNKNKDEDNESTNQNNNSKDKKKGWTGVQ